MTHAPATESPLSGRYPPPDAPSALTPPPIAPVSPAGERTWTPAEATLAIPVTAAAGAAPAWSEPTPETAAAPPVIPPAGASSPAEPGWAATQATQPDGDLFPELLYTEPPSRAGAHWWGVLVALVLSPIAWFLLTDGSARLFWSILADPENVNLAGYLSFAAGLVALGGVLLAARWSSVGAIVAGSLSGLVGLTFLVFPARTLEFLEGYREQVEELGGFGRNLYAYTIESGMRGTFVIGAVVLIGVGIVSHGARRKGRREEKAHLAVRAARGENPFA